MSIRLLTYLLLPFFLFSCGSSPAKKSYAVLEQEQFVIKQLNSQYEQWKGTSYKLGGMSKTGIDCSAFVQRTFDEKLKIKLPRETALQAKMGYSVSIKKLKPGDLIFFNTGKKIRHVGIYIDNNKFIHASTSKGVTISRLDNSYWMKSYWKSRRLR